MRKCKHIKSKYNGEIYGVFDRKNNDIIDLCECCFLKYDIRDENSPNNKCSYVSEEPIICE